jgi:23S rRNA (guanosine2251-2'-O)-methyltransferase
VRRDRLDAIYPRHQGVAAEVQPFAYTPFSQLKDLATEAGESALVLALDALQDPQNFGTLLRTALAVGATGVVLPERRAVGVTPAVVRSSAGAAEHLAVSQVPNLTRALDELKAVGLWVVGLDVREGSPYDETDLRGPLVVVVGSEGSGLGRLIREHCDLLVNIPMAGPTESLNAAVAGSILLYQVFRGRSKVR